MLTTTVQAAASRRDLLIHDIRTLLATISGCAQLLLRRAAQGGPELLALVDALQHIEEAAGRVGDLLGELADVHHIVTEHGRTIVVESQIGVGTTATVRLPLEVSRDEKHPSCTHSPQP